jgi:hypothetical protein
MDLPLVAGQFEFVPTRETYSIGLAMRWKTQKWIMRFDQFGISALNVVTMEGTFRVCYRPGGGGICGFSDVHGDATSTKLPWTWKGTDDGYPYGIKTGAHTAEFHYRGTAAICIFSRGCGPERHPWVRITFRDDNTMEVAAGVV